MPNIRGKGTNMLFTNRDRNAAGAFGAGTGLSDADKARRAARIAGAPQMKSPEMMGSGTGLSDADRQNLQNKLGKRRLPGSQFNVPKPARLAGKSKSPKNMPGSVATGLSDADREKFMMDPDKWLKAKRKAGISD